MTTLRFFIIASLLLLGASLARATSNHEYGPDEYVTVRNGLSPDGKFTITTHGEGELLPRCQLVRNG